MKEWMQSKVEHLLLRVLGHYVMKFAMLIPVIFITNYISGVLGIYMGPESSAGIKGILGPILVMISTWYGGYIIIDSPIDLFFHIVLLTIVSIECIYCCIFRKNIGHQILRMKIYSLNGDKPNVLQIIIRTVVKYSYLAFAPYLVVIPIFTPNNRGIHDYLSGTYVARKDQTLYDLRMRR